MGSVNRCILVGRLGADPEIRFTPGGKGVANFSLATDSVWKDASGEKQKATEWHRVVAWEPLAENVHKYLTKGREVYVEGEIRSRKYEDKEGATRQAFEIIARNVVFLSGGGPEAGARDSGGLPPPRREGRHERAHREASGDAPASGELGFGDPDPSDDDVPF